MSTLSAGWRLSSKQQKYRTINSKGRQRIKDPKHTITSVPHHSSSAGQFVLQQEVNMTLVYDLTNCSAATLAAAGVQLFGAAAVTVADSV